MSILELPECSENNGLDAHELLDGIEWLELFFEHTVEEDQTKDGNHLREVVGECHIGPGEFEVDLTLIVHIEYL